MSVDLKSLNYLLIPFICKFSTSCIVTCPVITQQPEDAKKTADGTATFLIKAKGHGLKFTWKKVGGILPPTLTATEGNHALSI